MDNSTYIDLRDEFRAHLRAVRNVHNELSEDKRLYPNGVPFLKGKEAALMDALEIVAKFRTGRL